MLCRCCVVLCRCCIVRPRRPRHKLARSRWSKKCKTNFCRFLKEGSRCKPNVGNFGRFSKKEVVASRRFEMLVVFQRRKSLKNATCIGGGDGLGSLNLWLLLRASSQVVRVKVLKLCGSEPCKDPGATCARMTRTNREEYTILHLIFAQSLLNGMVI